MSEDQRVRRELLGLEYQIDDLIGVIEMQAQVQPLTFMILWIPYGLLKMLRRCIIFLQTV